MTTERSKIAHAIRVLARAHRARLDGPDRHHATSSFRRWRRWRGPHRVDERPRRAGLHRHAAHRRELSGVRLRQQRDGHPRRGRASRRRRTSLLRRADQGVPGRSGTYRARRGLLERSADRGGRAEQRRQVRLRPALSAREHGRDDRQRVHRRRARHHREDTRSARREGLRHRGRGDERRPAGRRRQGRGQGHARHARGHLRDAADRLPLDRHDGLDPADGVRRTRRRPGNRRVPRQLGRHRACRRSPPAC